jgi:hypothetical protein
MSMVNQDNNNSNIKKLDRSLLKSSQILTRTFNYGKEYNPDLDLLVNPEQSDLVRGDQKKVNYFINN